MGWALLDRAFLRSAGLGWTLLGWGKLASAGLGCALLVLARLEFGSLGWTRLEHTLLVNTLCWFLAWLSWVRLGWAEFG